MNRFLVFAGYHYYPCGGWNDYAGSFDTKDEAVACVKQRLSQSDDWAHIVDTAGGAGIDYVYSKDDFREHE